MPTCIYCRFTDPPGGFTREHVLQVAFGNFRNALTLTDGVCAACNQFFGDRLDVVLARDSVEAVLRLVHGLKDPAQLAGMLKRHVRIRIPRDGSIWGGMNMELMAPRPGQDGLACRPVPQVGFERRDGTGWDYLTEDELRAAGDLAPRFESEWLPGEKQVITLGDERLSEDVHQRLVALMREHGVPVKGEDQERGITPEGIGDASVTWIVDEILARAVTKIAVNYLAYTQGAEFARRPEFEDVRRFVRDGSGRPPDFIRLQPGPVVEDTRGGEPPLCHLIVLTWSPGMRPPMLCRVTLFNRHAYLVRLCTTFYGPLWREVKSGHTYDLISWECRAHLRTTIMPPEGWAF